MARNHALIAVAVSTLFASACTSLELYRPVTAQPCSGLSDGERGCAIHELQYARGKVALGFVEFDDFGWFQDHRQIDAVLDYIRARQDETQEAGDGKKGALIFVYAHGWRHNAAIGDRDVGCFSTTLKLIDVLEQLDSARSGDKPRRVIGVYMGWRGKSLSGPGFWESLSFWDRKTTAENVGLGALTEALTRLDDVKNGTDQTRQDSPRGMEPDRAKNLLVLMGHSFGGQVMFRATSQFLLANVAVPPKDQPVRGYGDLIVLINPALEAAQFMPLFEAAKRQTFRTDQPALLVGLTSSADLATRVAFPIGRKFTWFNQDFRDDRSAEQNEAFSYTVGHFEPYRTHEARGQESRIDRPHPDCRFVDRAWLEGNGIDFGKNRATVTVVGDGTRRPSPYHMIYTDGHVILDHNDYFTPEFFDILLNKYIREYVSTERRHK
ncbi:MAG: hypothetical protein FJX47_06475 [Alphaproteobacteria bacterium]|nr:hypothetical protein [Alphaproteobacteria bacterium]